MSDLRALNSSLKSAHPSAWACLSDLGRRLYFPLGIPAQAQEARACTINATIGQITDGHSGAMPLGAMVDPLAQLPPEQVVLYTPTAGNPTLRDLWAERLESQGCAPLSSPLVTQGLTHGLSIVADLFVDPDTDVFLPSPGWGNYRHIFETRRGARVHTYSPVSRTGLDLDAIDSALSSASPGSVLILNFPSNPIGYSPTEAEAEALVARIQRHPHPLVVVTDDAYQGMVWEPGLLEGSLFPLLSRGNPSHILPIKIDGATKELFFFGGRIGFLSFGCEGAAGDALEEKGRAIIRSTISSCSTLSQNLVIGALEDPELPTQTREMRDQILNRYRQLSEKITQAGIETWPFNSAFFVLIPVRSDPESIRQELLSRGVGVISLPSASAIRLSYASVAPEDIDGLVRSLQDVLG